MVVEDQDKEETKTLNQRFEKSYNILWTGE